MLKIYKYSIEIKAMQRIALPQGAKILSVDSQHGKPVFWALGNPIYPPETRVIRCFGTGQDVSQDYDNYVFLGTVKLEGESFILHVFEEKA